MTLGLPPRELTPHEIRDEHAQLRELMIQVRLELAARKASRARIVAMLTALTDCVLEHFLHEETGGYFAKVLEAAPRLIPRAEGLCQEHPQMATRLEELHRVATGTADAALWWATLEAGFAEFLERFQAHEAAENALIQEAYCDDLGAED